MIKTFVLSILLVSFVTAGDINLPKGVHINGSGYIEEEINITNGSAVMYK